MFVYQSVAPRNRSTLSYFYCIYLYCISKVFLLFVTQVTFFFLKLFVTFVVDASFIFWRYFILYLLLLHKCSTKIVIIKLLRIDNYWLYPKWDTPPIIGRFIVVGHYYFLVKIIYVYISLLNKMNNKQKIAFCFFKKYLVEYKKWKNDNWNKNTIYFHTLFTKKYVQYLSYFIFSSWISYITQFFIRTLLFNVSFFIFSLNLSFHLNLFSFFWLLNSDKCQFETLLGWKKFHVLSHERQKLLELNWINDKMCLSDNTTLRTWEQGSHLSKSRSFRHLICEQSHSIPDETLDIIKKQHHYCWKTINFNGENNSRIISISPSKTVVNKRRGRSYKMHT